MSNIYRVKKDVADQALALKERLERAYGIRFTNTDVLSHCLKRGIDAVTAELLEQELLEQEGVLR